MERSLAESRDFGLTFVRLIAGMAVDPHGYFELKYAASIAISWSWAYDVMDLIQAANEGLALAVPKFDPERASLATYSTDSING